MIRHGNFRAAGKILAGERCGICCDFFGRSCGQDMSARGACAGAEIDHVVGAANRFFIMLDYEHRIAEVAQGFKSAEQAAIVAGVQADGRLIENIEDAAQARADLRGEADALRFAAGERGGRAVESEIAEPHVEKKIEALGDFRERATSYFSLAEREVAADFVNGSARFGERERGEIGDGKTGDFYGEAFGAQAALVASRTGRRRHILREPFAVRVGIRFFEAFLKMRDDALKIEALHSGAVRRIAMKNQILNFSWKLLEWSIEIETVRCGGKFHGALNERGT